MFAESSVRLALPMKENALEDHTQYVLRSDGSEPYRSALRLTALTKMLKITAQSDRTFKICLYL